MQGWSEKRALITVRTYPVPARKGVEVSCTAGVAEDGTWIRLFPIPYRSLEEDKRFKKYQWITAKVIKATDDVRPESYKIDIGSIRIGEMVPTNSEWRLRKELVRHLIRPSLCSIQRERDAKKFPTLGLFKPASIKRLVIKPASAGWTHEQLALLKQTSMFEGEHHQTLEKLPVDFLYEFECDDPECTGHRLSCTDWEMGQSYRRWRRDYGDGWERAFRQKYEHEMIDKLDTHFYVGTIHHHPATWIIVGLFYPPRISTPDLFG